MWPRNSIKPGHQTIDSSIRWRVLQTKLNNDFMVHLSQLDTLMAIAKVVVPVPPLAESLSEGTVKQLTKRFSYCDNQLIARGRRVCRTRWRDYLDWDRQGTYWAASPANVKIDVAVNAPEAGTITQWFVSEEDNVEVGQKLCEIDTEGKASGGMSSLYHILMC